MHHDGDGSRSDPAAPENLADGDAFPSVVEAAPVSDAVDVGDDFARGRRENSSQLQEISLSTSPKHRKDHSERAIVGTAPYVSTGHLAVKVWCGAIFRPKTETFEGILAF
jgi:hypothetical protein